LDSSRSRTDAAPTRIGSGVVRGSVRLADYRPMADAVVTAEGRSATGDGARSPFGERAPTDGERLLIQGRVTDGQGLPVAGATVRALEVRMRDERPFGGDVVSDADGHYAITAVGEGGNAPSPNVRVAVVDRAGAELASSAVRYGWAQTEPIDVSL